MFVVGGTKATGIRIQAGVGWVRDIAAALSSSVEDGVLDWAAMLAFYFLFALFPVVLLVAALLAAVHAQGLVYNLTTTLSRNLPHNAAALISQQLHGLLQSHISGLVSFNIVVLVYSVSQGFAALMAGLNTAYEVQETRCYARRLLLSMLLTASAGMLLALALLVVVLGQHLVALLSGPVHLGRAMGVLWPVVRWGATFVLMIGSVYLLYRFAPDVRHDNAGLLPAVVVAMVIWIIASALLAVYMNRFANYSAVYGSLGAIVALMLWFYVLALALLFGAELHAARLRRRRVSFGKPLRKAA